MNDCAAEPICDHLECVELMLSANNLTVPYAEAMLLATPEELLVEGKKPPKVAGDAFKFEIIARAASGNQTATGSCLTNNRPEHRDSRRSNSAKIL